MDVWCRGWSHEEEATEHAMPWAVLPEPNVSGERSEEMLHVGFSQGSEWIAVAFWSHNEGWDVLDKSDRGAAFRVKFETAVPVCDATRSA